MDLFFALEQCYGERWATIVINKMIEKHPEYEEELKDVSIGEDIA